MIYDYVLDQLFTFHLSLSSLIRYTQDYKFLIVFNCLCFPYSRPFAGHKLEFWSCYCVCLSYPFNYHGQCCLDLLTARIARLTTLVSTYTYRDNLSDRLLDWEFHFSVGWQLQKKGLLAQLINLRMPSQKYCRHHYVPYYSTCGDQSTGL